MWIPFRMWICFRYNLCANLCNVDSTLFYGHKQTPFAKVLTSLGLCSTMMWFIHAIPFSTAVRGIFQTAPIWTNNSILLFIFVTIISYALALMYNKTVSYMKSKSVNKVV